MNRKFYSSNKSHNSGDYPFSYVPPRVYTKKNTGSKNTVVLFLFNFYPVRGYAPKNVTMINVTICVKYFNKLINKSISGK